jgi:hypothetical protein
MVLWYLQKNITKKEDIVVKTDAGIVRGIMEKIKKVVLLKNNLEIWN